MRISPIGNNLSLKKQTPSFSSKVHLTHDFIEEFTHSKNANLKKDFLKQIKSLERNENDDIVEIDWRTILAYDYAPEPSLYSRVSVSVIKCAGGNKIQRGDAYAPDYDGEMDAYANLKELYDEACGDIRSVDINPEIKKYLNINA